MGGVTFNKCCFCIDLRVGCLILGYLQLISSIILCGLTLFAILAVNVVNHDTQSSQSEHSKEEAMYLDGVTSIVNIMGIVLMPFLVLILAFSIVLLVGIHKDKPKHVKAFLIYDMIFIVLFAIMIIVKISKGVTNDAISGFINIALSIYFWFVIRSYYYKMKETRPQAVYSA